MSADPEQPSYAALLRPGGRGRRAVPRPDPDRHQQLRRRVRAGRAEGGRARRRPARRGRDRVRAVRARVAGGRRWSRSGAGRRADEGALLLHGHLDVVPAAAEDWQVDPFSGRDPGRLRLGSRRGRHEGLRRDAALGGAGAHPGRRRARTARSCCASPPTRRPAACTAPRCWSRSTASTWRTAPRRSARSAASARRSAGQRLYLIEAAEKGMAWMKLTARGRAGHGSMINDDNAVSRLTAAVARIGAHEWPVRLTPDDADAAGRGRRDGRHRGDAGERRGAGRGVRRGGPDDRRGHPQHRQPDDAAAPATR